MIRPAQQPDWFLLDEETFKSMRTLIGVQRDPRGGRVHRSHLPLMQDLVAQRILSNGVSGSTARWAQRDTHTEALGFKLRTTQQQAIDYITRRRGALIGDDPRVGKTASAICSHDPTLGPLFIVAPLSTRGVWLGWCRRVFPQLEIGVIAGRKFDQKTLERPIVFGHYDVIHRWQSITANKIGTLVFDEAHLLTNRRARRTIAAAFLQCYAQRVIALTGTPIWRLPPDLWSVVNLVAPGAWGSYHEFANRYGAPKPTAYGTAYTGVSNEIELGQRLSEVMLRRRWMDVIGDLPPITRSVLVAEVDLVDGRRLDLLADKLRSERSNTVGNLAAYRRQVTTIKLGVTVAEAKKISQRNESVVVWTWHKDFANTIGEACKSPYVIHGDVSATERDERIEAWKQDPAGILIATMAVAQVGIDLSHAKSAIFAEIDYTPAVLGQAEMRTFAPSRPMDITFVVANHLVDQRIVRALVTKLGAADPLGVGAAVDSIDALRTAVLGEQIVGDLDRLLEDLIASQS